MYLTGFSVLGENCSNYYSVTLHICSLMSVKRGEGIVKSFPLAHTGADSYSDTQVILHVCGSITYIKCTFFPDGGGFKPAISWFIKAWGYTGE